MTSAPFRVIAILVLGLGLLAAPAAAKVHHLAPPGNSAIGQYLETIPTAAGGQPTNGVSHSGRSHGASGLPASTSRALAAQGPVGVADASMIQATAPSGAPAGHPGSARSTRSSGSPSGGTSAGSPPVPPASASPDPASSVLKALTGSTNSGGGLGVLVPVLLAVAFVVGGGLALWRRRRAAE